MSFYPILAAPGCNGWTTVCNFAPNNWEEGPRIARYLNVTWSDGHAWQSRPLGRLRYGEMKTVHAADMKDLVPEDCLPLLSLTDREPPLHSPTLVSSGMPQTSYPNWRATLGLTTRSGTSTSYQGELDPFPAPGSLLTFGHFLQVGPRIENYLLFVNLEVSPVIRTAQLEVRTAASPDTLQARCEVKNNSVSVVRLDWPGLREDDLPLLICRSMSGIPLYFSRSGEGEFVSLEHTHPPASSVIHGRRFEAQKLLKQIWFSKVGQA